MNEVIERIRQDIEVPAELAAEIDQAEIDACEASVYKLSDAIREGSAHSEQSVGSWGQGTRMCALTAAYASAKARNYC